MPHTKTAPHPRTPGLEITFDEAAHSYTDSDGMRYESVTAVVKRACRPFDAAGISRAKAERETDRSELEWERIVEERAAALRAEWAKKGATSADYGTRVHETAEAIVLGAPMPHEPQNARERAAFGAVWEHIAELHTARPDILLMPEVILFSPQLYLAGTTDLLAYDPEAQELFILDWKTNEKLTAESFRGSEYMLPPLDHLQDANLNHYALQLSLYARILTREGYIDHLSGPVRTITPMLLWIPQCADPCEVQPIPVPLLRHETAELLLLRASTAVPF